jgi:hypothetical protein
MIMKRAAALMALLLLAFACVAGTQIVDRVPRASPKGYVKFYFLKNEGAMPVDASVSSWRMGEKVPFKLEEEGDFGMGKYYTTRSGFYSPVTNERSLLVAKTPGKYCFEVKTGDTSPRFEILVQEGMVVPIRFKFTDINVKKKYEEHGGITGRWKTITFKMEAFVEKPIPFVPKK